MPASSPAHVGTGLAAEFTVQPYAWEMATVRLRGQLDKLAGGGSEHQVPGDTVSDLLHALETTFGALEGWILDERGVLRPHVNVFVNGVPAQPDTPVAQSDKIEILPAISGG